MSPKQRPEVFPTGPRGAKPNGGSFSPALPSGFSLDLPWTVLSSLTDFCPAQRWTERGARRGCERLSLLWLTCVSETEWSGPRGTLWAQGPGLSLTPVTSQGL